MQAPRRQLLTAGAALLGAGLAGCQAGKSSSRSSRSPMLKPGATVLFQGDSITDASRSRETADQPGNQAALGKGYAWLASAGMLSGRPELDLQIYNRGISGNKVHQLDARWDKDCIDLKPDVLSILIGVNDIWHARNGTSDGTVEVYEADYHALLERTVAALPNVRLVICEPFVLPCGAVDDSWQPEFDTYRAAARRVAKAQGAAWVPFHTMFEEALALAPAEHWAGDGVHPSAEGAALMAQEWLRVVSG